MIRTINIFLKLAVWSSCLCMLSCADDNALRGDEGIRPSGGGIEIVTGISGYVPVKSTETDFEVGDSIGMYVTKRTDLNEPIELKATGNYANNVKWIKTADGWAPATARDKLNFPADGTAIDFYAYYPYNRLSTNPLEMTFQIKADQGRREAYTTSDLMMATNLKGVREGKVELVFKHQLAMVTTQFVPATGVDLGDIPLAKITGMATKVKLNWSTVDCSVVEGSVGDVMMFRTNETGYHYNVILPMQTALKANIFCLKGSDEYRFASDEIVLKTGEKKSFILSVK